MRYRRLGANNEPAMGQSRQDFVSDVEAVGQAIVTKLRLFKGEWWEDTNIGLPLWQSMLGIIGVKKEAIDQILQNSILQTPGVRRIIFMSSIFNRDSRDYDFSISVSTVFGETLISNQGEIQR